MYLDQDEEVFPAEAERLGLHVSLQSQDDYFSMLVNMYLLLDSQKPKLEDLTSMIHNGRELVFDIPWLRDMQEELEKQMQVFEGLKDVKTTCVCSSVFFIKLFFSRKGQYVWTGGVG